jgi:hypothetical protein
VKWAKVDESGALLDGHGVASVKKVGFFYNVTFDRDVADCAVIAGKNTGTGETFVGLANTVEGRATIVITNAHTNENDMAGLSVAAYC